MRHGAEALGNSSMVTLWNWRRPGDLQRDETWYHSHSVQIQASQQCNGCCLFLSPVFLPGTERKWWQMFLHKKGPNWMGRLKTTETNPSILRLLSKHCRHPYLSPFRFFILFLFVFTRCSLSPCLWRSEASADGYIVPMKLSWKPKVLNQRNSKKMTTIWVLGELFLQSVCNLHHPPIHLHKWKFSWSFCTTVCIQPTFSDSCSRMPSPQNVGY